MKNPYTVDGPVTTIFMTMKDGTEVCALIDTEDIPKAAQYRWHAAKQRDSYRIVCHKRLEPKGPKRAIYLHRVVMGVTAKDQFVDHINCDPRDNRKANLRHSDYKANGQNRKAQHPTNTSGYRNVCWAKKVNKWQAMFTVDGKGIFLGYYKTAEEANSAVVAARAKLMPYSQEAHTTQLSPVTPVSSLFLQR